MGTEFKKCNGIAYANLVFYIIHPKLINEFVIFVSVALVPSQPGEKLVNYPTRPVDASTDFEGTTNIHPHHQVKLFFHIVLLKHTYEI